MLTDNSTGRCISWSSQITDKNMVHIDTGCVNRYNISDACWLTRKTARWGRKRRNQNVRAQGLPQVQGGHSRQTGTMYGSYRQCLQCGYMKDIESPNRLLESLALAPSKKKVA